MSRLLTQNADLKPHRIWNWTLPAWVVRLDDGRPVNVCPQAGACVPLCYARSGKYTIPSVRAAHQRNLQFTIDDLDAWTHAVSNELRARRFRPIGIARLRQMNRGHLDVRVARLLDIGCAAVRIHDAGDFYSDEYLAAWIRIARTHPDILFYCYTKEVSRFKRCVLDPPHNFLWAYSLGGREDHLVDRDTDRHADVFATPEAITEAGYFDQTPCDLLCVVAPATRIGMPANNIPPLRRRAAGRRYSEIEAALTRHGRHRIRPAPQRTQPPEPVPAPAPQRDLPDMEQLSLFAPTSSRP